MPPGASIVNILSVAAKTGFAGWSAYCMSKFALEGLSQSIREELREHKVRLINIYPAATATEIWTNIGGEWPREKMISADQVADAVVFAITQPAEVLVENITLGNLTGSL
jgi:NADP-dependent 3-hydroxy acid dehydrogenase YdfG